MKADKAQPFAESVERHFGIERSSLYEVNKFIEDNHGYVYPPEDPPEKMTTGWT